MRYFAPITLAILIGLLPARLASQEQPGSMRDLDVITARLTARINQRLNSQVQEGESLRVSMGSFDGDGSPSPLGALWALNLSRDLANAPNRRYDVLADNRIPGEFQLNGELVESADAVRIYIRLVKNQDQTLAASWHTDLEKTPFVQGLLERPEPGAVVRDRYETDSRENPLAAPIGETWIRRSIHSRDDQDWFLITAEQGGLVRAETSGNIDTYMELYDASDGSRLQSDDDGGEGGNARINFGIEPGKPMIIMVRGFSGNTGNYQFRVIPMELPDQALEPNETAEAAKTLEQGRSREAYLSSAEDVDWYRLEIPANGGSLTAILSGKAPMTVGIYDAQHNKLAEGNSRDGSARISTLAAGGTVYLKVGLAGGAAYNAAEGLYTLQTRLRSSFSSDIFEPDNEQSQAKDLIIGAPQRRSFTTGDDLDWVRIQITQQGRYGIRARGERDRDLDTYLELFNDQNRLIDEDDDGGSDFDAYISTNLAPGTYYLKVSCLDSEPQDYYMLSIEAE